MTVIEIIAQALYDGNAGGTTDPILQDMAEATCKNDAEIAVKALEEAGYRIVPVEPTEQQLFKAHKVSVCSLEVIRAIYKEMLEAVQ